jgi:hypothetical protein
MYTMSLRYITGTSLLLVALLQSAAFAGGTAIPERTKSICELLGIPVDSTWGEGEGVSTLQGRYVQLESLPCDLSSSYARSFSAVIEIRIDDNVGRPGETAGTGLPGVKTTTISLSRGTRMIFFKTYTNNSYLVYGQQWPTTTSGSSYLPTDLLVSIIANLVSPPVVTYEGTILSAATSNYYGPTKDLIRLGPAEDQYRYVLPLVNKVLWQMPYPEIIARTQEYFRSDGIPFVERVRLPTAKDIKDESNQAFASSVKLTVYGHFVLTPGPWRELVTNTYPAYLRAHLPE